MLNIIGVIFSFILVVYLLYRKVNLGLSMLIGSFTIGIMGNGQFMKRLINIIRTFINGLTEPVTIELVLLVSFVSILAYTMEQTGMIKKLIKSIQNLVSSLRLNLLIIPSLIGVLPIPGGAVFSAPIIKPIGKDLKMSRDRLVSINLFYRHLWYFVFPYFPSLIVASSLSGISIASIAKLHLPIVLIMLLVGKLYFFRGVKEPEIETGNNISFYEKIKEFLYAFSPLLIIVGLPIFLPVNFLFSLVIGLIYVIIINKNKFKMNMIIKGFNIQLAFGVFGIMIFRTFLENSEGIYIITNGLIESGMSPIFLAIGIPFLTGMITGNQTGAIGISYPLLIPIISQMNEFYYWHIILYSASFFGYYLSPFHLCNILTLEYYKSNIMKMYKEMYIPISASILGIVFLIIFYFNL